MKIIGIIIMIGFLILGILSYTTDENFKELSNAIITIVGLLQAYDVFFSKENKETEEKLSMILRILEDKKKE